MNTGIPKSGPKTDLNAILFFGELPPFAVHGISLSNELNTRLLSDDFRIVTIQEVVNLRRSSKRTLQKATSLAKYLYQCVYQSCNQRFSYFYLTLSMSTGGSIKTLCMALIFRLLNRAPIILHIHRGDFFQFFSKKINHSIVTLLFKTTSKLIVLSDNQARQFSVIFKKKIDVLENSVLVEYNLGPKVFKNYTFVFISNYFLEKGILDLLEAFTSSSRSQASISLECFGDSPDQNILDRALAFGSSAISINATIHDEAKIRKIHESHCLILPSWNEGQPTVLLEAMSQGTPIIATDVGLIRELLGESYPYLCKPRDIGGLEAMINQFIEDPNKQQISDYLRGRYQTMYSNEVHRAKLSKIFSIS